MKRYILIGILSGIRFVAFGQSNIVINPNGGASSNLDDGLKILIQTNGYIHVYREDKAQNYNGEYWGASTNDDRSVKLRFAFERNGSYQPALENKLCPFVVCSTTPAVQNGQNWTASMSGYVTSFFDGLRFYVTMNFTYTYPNKYFAVDYIVRAPLNLIGDPQIVHIYLDHDAYILGHDASVGYRNKNATGEIVGDYREPNNYSACQTAGGSKNPRFPSHHGFKADATGFRSYYTGSYYPRMDMYANLTLTNTVTNSCTDDGIAVEFVTPALSAGQSSIRRVLHCYGENKGEFDNTPVNTPVAPNVSSSTVTVNFTSNAYNVAEGDNTHTANNIQVVVSGGTLALDQILTMSATNGTAAQNTDYSYMAGFIIPAGNYSTAKTLTLNNINIIGNTNCQNNRDFTIKIDANNCNDLVIQGSTINQATVTIVDDDAPTVNQPSDASYCSGTVVPSNTWVFSGSSVSGTTYSWSATNAAAIGLPNSLGAGNLPAFTTANATHSAIVSTVTVTPIKGTCNGTAKTFTITVNPKTTVSIAGLSDICVGTTTQLLPKTGGNWTSTNSAVATVTNSGLVTGVSKGTARFIFTPSVAGCCDTTGIITVDTFPTVNPITAAKNVICQNETIQLNGSPSGGVWKISNSNAQINGTTSNNPANIQGKTAGRTFVSYTVGTGTCQSTATFLLEIRPNILPEIRIGFEK